MIIIPAMNDPEFSSPEKKAYNLKKGERFIYAEVEMEYVALDGNTSHCLLNGRRVMIYAGAKVKPI